LQAEDIAVRAADKGYRTLCFDPLTVANSRLYGFAFGLGMINSAYIDQAMVQLAALMRQCLLRH
jgi:hypothetical protein